MKKLAKIIACAALAVACVSAAALAACGGGAETYTYKVTGKDTEVNGAAWGTQVIFSGYFSGQTSVPGDDAYMEDTLTLNGDGSYVLVKYVNSSLSDDIETLIKGYAGDDADLSALTPIELKYTYYGTYTQDGDTVTLSKATSADYSETFGPMSTYVNMSKDGSKTGITDETETEVNGEVIVMSTIYGPFLAENIEKGNCSQQVKVSDDGALTFLG